ncbi:hypothetical protein [Rhodanobacter sp. PCA2]|uniref:hypothetical protein n=1 Tax=Rhodanobacter sp. PCA2 TaxID=2006117 RepID=UPI0015E7DE40|nr:hypothetical protein [Rhodanobacter sp. PCA2]
MGGFDASARIPGLFDGDDIAMRTAAPAPQPFRTRIVIAVEPGTMQPLPGDEEVEQEAAPRRRATHEAFVLGGLRRCGHDEPSRPRETSLSWRRGREWSRRTSLAPVEARDRAGQNAAAVHN